MKYEVRHRLVFVHEVEAKSEKEAVRLAQNMTAAKMVDDGWVAVEIREGDVEIRKPGGK